MTAPKAPMYEEISGDTAPERLREAQESGHHLLHKPVPPMKLRNMLSQLLTSRNVAGAAWRSKIAPSTSAACGVGTDHAARGCTSRSIARPLSSRALVRSCIAC